MIKYIGRAKHKKGAVLFAVVCVMALLIAMASTAYYTARSAYNSVVSNYNYSQLYLSAISVADMVSDSVSNSAVSGSEANNDYEALRNAVYTLETPGAYITAHSANISDPSATEQAIINELANQNSVVAGALDGVVVKVELVNNTDFMPISPNPYIYTDGTGRKCYWFKYVYRFTTTAYYRNNTITVEDIVETSKAKIWTPDPGSPGTDPTDPIYPPPDPDRTPHPDFTTFFTATGQQLNDADPNSIYGDTHDRVKITVHEISDDAFFQNENTHFVDVNGPNTFVGGITSTGSVFLEKFTTNIASKDPNDPTTANDWYIGKDLVITNANSNNLDLKNNNLYVGRDLVLAGTGSKITAEDIYVDGDLYVLGQATINGNLHVTGNIYYQMGDTIIDENGKEASSAAVNGEGGDTPLQSTDFMSQSNWVNSWSISGNLDLNGKVVFPEYPDENGDMQKWTDPQNVTINGSPVTFTDNFNASASGGAVGTYNPTEVTVDVVSRVEDEDSDSYKSVSKPMSVTDAINNKTSDSDHYSYTAEDFVYKNELNIDFNNLKANPVEADGQILYYECTVTATDGEVITIKSDSNDLTNGNITVSIPYNVEFKWETDPDTGEKYKVMTDGGYILNIAGDSFEDVGFSNAKITYEIETKGGEDGMSVPIVLKDNIVTDEGKKGFSWQGEKYGDMSLESKVIAKGEGNVTLEMANIDENGNYVPYDNPDAYADYESVVYVSASKEAVGNQNQIDSLGSNYKIKDVASGWYSTNPVPKDEYQNQFALISNANGGTAVDANRLSTAFCGYVYAPNGNFLNNAGTGSDPVFGGMIVSTYSSELSYLYYSEPKPSLLESLFEGMKFKSGTGGTTQGDTPPPIPGTPGTPPTPPPGTGSYGPAVPADYWNQTGSNYVG